MKSLSDFTYNIERCPDTFEWIATVEEWPSLSYISPSIPGAIQGLRDVITDFIEEQDNE